MDMRRSEGILLSAVNPKFLHSNSTSHTWPFSAVAGLIDNAYDPDVMAKQFWIDWTQIKEFDCLTFQDNGSVSGSAISKPSEVPIITIGHDGQSPAEDAASLQDILKHSPFNTVEELLTELRAITSISSTGTRIIIWNLRRVANGETEFDLSTDRYDIRIPADACEVYKHRGVTQSVPEIIYSLRAYCSILYLKPRMQIIIRGQKVKTELISKSLALTRKDQYKPVFLKERILITFGYNIKSKDEYGMMMYHKNRLIKAFERVGCQRKSGHRGIGVIGVIECNFLKPTHNKQDFDETEDYRKTMNNLAVKLEEYWDEIQYKRKGYSIPIQEAVKRPDRIWLQCDDCQKWRRLPDGIDSDLLPEKWFCRINPDPQYRSCQVEEEPEDSEDEQQCDPKPYKRLKKMSKIQEKKDQQQTSAPALPLPVPPLSGSERRRPADHVSTSLERVKQVPPHAVGASSSDTETRETCENGGAGNGPQSPMLEVQQQPDGLQDAYKEQVNQVQQELEEMKHKCENLQVMEIEFQKRLEDMELKNSSLSYKCEQLNRELEQLRTNGGTGRPALGKRPRTTKLRNLRQWIGRLLVTFVPTLVLEEINLDSDVMDKILDEVLNEVTEV